MFIFYLEIKNLFQVPRLCTLVHPHEELVLGTDLRVILPAVRVNAKYLFYGCSSWFRFYSFLLLFFW